MLEAPPSETTKIDKPSSSSCLLFSFVPRQVTLAKHQNMKKEELLSETLTVELTNKDKSKKKKKRKKKKNNGFDPSPLLLSIASFLQHKGFTKTLAAFQSEASIAQIDDSKVHGLDLEEIFNKYFQTSTSDTKSEKNVPEELGMPNAGVIEEDQGKGKSTAKTAHTDNTAPESQLHESEGKSKVKKRKKNKIAVENGDSEICTLEGKFVAEKSSTEIQLDEEPVKHKSKKKKNKSLEPASKQDGKEFEQVEFCKVDSNKESNLALENATESIDKKSSKKRKRMVSEGNESQPDVSIKTNGLGKENVGALEDNTAYKDKKSSKKRKKMTTEGNEIQLDGDEKKAGSLSLDDVVPENGFVEDRNTDKKSETPIKGVFHTNGDVEKNGRAGTGSQKSMKKQQNGSSEPKAAFQRVKIEEVKFADDRLQDNSYWAKSGADIGYGAKAQEVLGQVRGRDFRHEKTKKKRGSYRGGQIDLQTHSIKFNYSDEE